MIPSFQFDELYVISDLHFGGKPGFQIFGSTDEMVWFINFLSRRPSEVRTALVINGDFIDFLAEEPARHFDPLGALAKLKRITMEDETFVPIFKALRNFLLNRNRSLIINLGNHDLELALPWMKQALINVLCENDHEAFSRLHLVFDGSGVLASVGGKSVLCVHGNEVDAFNPTDFEKIRQIGRDIQLGRPIEDWIPNAGTQMVIDVMNQVKSSYPFVDLLKPEVPAVIPTLAACDPSQASKLKNLRGLAGVGKKLVQTGITHSGLLGEAAQNDLARNSATMVLSGAENVAESSDIDAQTMMRRAEQQVQNNTRPMDLIQNLQGEQLGGLDAVFDFIRGKPTAEVLRETLEYLDTDSSFDTRASDSTFTRLDEEISGSIDFLVAGHTHLARARKRSSGGGIYFNSGTWARLIQIRPEVRKDPIEFGKLFSTLKNGKMSTLDNTPGLILKRCTVVAIRREPSRVVGELCQVEREADDTFDLVPLEGTRLPEYQ